jgi:vacuolar-type H+-ATPase subunit I/STV1
MDTNEMSKAEKSRTAVKEWRKRNRDKWNKYQREYHQTRRATDPEFKRRQNESKVQSRERMLEKNPDYTREKSRNYYEKNREKVNMKNKVRHYHKKLAETMNEFDDDDYWFHNALKGCKSDDVVKAVVESIDEYLMRNGHIGFEEMMESDLGMSILNPC